MCSTSGGGGGESPDPDPGGGKPPEGGEYPVLVPCFEIVPNNGDPYARPVDRKWEFPQSYYEGVQPWKQWGGKPTTQFLANRRGARGNGYNACPLPYTAYMTTGLSVGYPTQKARVAQNQDLKARFVWVSKLNAYVNLDELRNKRGEIIVVCFWKGSDAPSENYKDYSEETAPIEYILIPSPTS